MAETSETPAPGLPEWSWVPEWVNALNVPIGDSFAFGGEQLKSHPAFFGDSV